MEILPVSYKPTKAELEEDLRIDAAPEEVALALMQNVTVVDKSMGKHRSELRARRTKRPGK